MKADGIETVGQRVQQHLVRIAERQMTATDAHRQDRCQRADHPTLRSLLYKRCCCCCGWGRKIGTPRNVHSNVEKFLRRISVTVASNESSLCHATLRKQLFI
jgi:hypothetical protein